tara:strand:- start:123 stop:392 length:270 start_codon:yes stop_codon:yes gene_type:complete
MEEIQDFLKTKGIEDKIVDFDYHNEPLTPSYIIEEWERNRVKFLKKGWNVKQFDSWALLRVAILGIVLGMQLLTLYIEYKQHGWYWFNP